MNVMKFWKYPFISRDWKHSFLARDGHLEGLHSEEYVNATRHAHFGR